MAVSEIDDIFASRSAKGKGKARSIDSAPIATPSSSTVEQKRAKKRKRKLAKEETVSTTQKVSSVLERSAPITVHDPSAVVLGAPKTKRRKVESLSNEKPKVKTKSSGQGRVEDDKDRFNDSRGTGPRRKTEEGWAVYKEDELGIGDQGGDTPLCPFDCECCF